MNMWGKMMKLSRGFTLAELLVVVAIIGVLVAVSIPIFSSQLERSREATDAANIRAQYAQVMTEAIVSGKSVNKDAGMFPKVILRQRKNDWQDSAIAGNLHGIMEVAAGESPVAGGTAWVEFQSSPEKVILHYENGSGGGSSGGGGITTATGGLADSDSNGNITITSWDMLTDKDNGPLLIDPPSGPPDNRRQTIKGVREGKSLKGALTIKEGPTDIHNNAFLNQKELTSVVFSTTIKEISQYAFSGTGLQSVALPEGVNVSKYAFSDIKNLKTIDWHFKSDTKYEGPLFSGSGGSEKIQITFHGTQEQWESVKGKLGLDESKYDLSLQ